MGKRRKLSYPEKEKYVRNHICTVKEYLQEVNKNLKWISEDIKFLEKITRPQEEVL